MDNFLFGTIEIKRMNLRSLPRNVQIWSYLMVFLPILCIPTYAIYKLIITPGRTFDEVFQTMCNEGEDRACSSLLASPTSRST